MNRIAAALISRIAASIADRMFDVLIRTMILEGAAGVPHGTWTRAHPPRLDEAGRHLNLPEDSYWTRNSNTGMYTMLVSTATNMLGRSGVGDMAEDLVQKILSGESLPSVPGGELYAVGRLIKDDLERDLPGIRQPSSMTNARKLLVAHLKQRALNEIRGTGREKKRYGPGVGEGGTTEQGAVVNSPAANLFTGDAFDSAFEKFLSGPKADQARQWLRETWSDLLRPSEFKVMQVRLDNPDMNIGQVAKVLGVDGSFVGRTFTRARQIARDEARENPPSFFRDLLFEEVQSSMGTEGYRMARKLLK